MKLGGSTVFFTYLHPWRALNSWTDRQRKKASLQMDLCWKQRWEVALFLLRDISSSGFVFNAVVESFWEKSTARFCMTVALWNSTDEDWSILHFHFYNIIKLYNHQQKYRWYSQRSLIKHKWFLNWFMLTVNFTFSAAKVITSSFKKRLNVIVNSSIFLLVSVHLILYLKTGNNNVLVHVFRNRCRSLLKVF